MLITCTQNVESKIEQFAISAIPVYLHCSSKMKLLYTGIPVKPHSPTSNKTTLLYALSLYWCIFIDLICRWMCYGEQADMRVVERLRKTNSSRLIDSLISACFIWHRIDGFSPAPPPDTTYLYALDEALLNYLSQSVIKCANNAMF